MKEYIAKTGGRYTYNDDLLNLQELAISMTAIFEGCSNFIISGCEVAGGKITPGYVWLGGKVRRFEGAADPAFPYYIYEKNGYETIAYAGDVNKHGRCNYLAAGGKAVPEVADEVTGALPSFIEMRPDYAPRFIDKFIGRYAVLLDSPFARQRIDKELVLAGTLTGEKDIRSKTAVSVVNSENGYELKNIVKGTGDAGVGVYHNGLLVHEIVIGTSGTFTLWRQGTQIASFGPDGLRVDTVSAQTGDFSSLRIGGSSIFNRLNATDDGSVDINAVGYNGGRTKFRTLNVYDGKSSVPLFTVEGKNGLVAINALAAVRNSGYGLQIVNTTYAKSDVLLKNTVSWLDKEGASLALAGFADAVSLDFTLRNLIGNLVLASAGWIDVRGEMRLGGSPGGGRAGLRRRIRPESEKGRTDGRRGRIRSIPSTRPGWALCSGMKSRRCTI